MAGEILNDKFILRLSKKGFNPLSVPATELSLHLDLGENVGANAIAKNNITLHPHGAIKDVLSAYVMKEGRDSEAALKLGHLLLENEMKDSAKIIEEELKKYNIDFSSYVERVSNQPTSVPSSCLDRPGGTREASASAAGTGPAFTTDKQMGTFAMAGEILNDKFILQLSKKGFNPLLVPATELSLHLDLGENLGANAIAKNNITLHPHGAIKDVLSAFVMKEGRDIEAALKLGRLLLENEMKDSAKIIEKELKKYNIDFSSYVERVSDQPTSVPSNCLDRPDDIQPDGDGLYKDRMITAASPTKEQLDEERNYASMYRSKKKGLAYILNNSLFPKRTGKGRERKGSEIDLQNVEHLFTQLGYECIPRENASANVIMQDMDSLVDKINKEGPEKHSSLVLFLMSHGNPSAILGTDEIEVSYKEIMERLSGRKCRALVEKPKMVFVQACRGDNVQKSAADVDGKQTQSEYDEKMAESMEKKDGDADDKTSLLNQFLEVDYTNIPDNADIYLAYATSYGYFSMRSTVSGSWFVQAICEEFIARAHVDDLDTMMEAVNRRVTKLSGTVILPSGLPVKALQNPEVNKRVGKKIYFAPKYPLNPASE